MALALVLAAVTTGIVAAYQWTQSRYYVGAHDGEVAIYQGVQQGIGPIALSSVYEETGIPTDSLPPYWLSIVESTINADDLAEARDIVDRLEVMANE